MSIENEPQELESEKEDLVMKKLEEYGGYGGKTGKIYKDLLDRVKNGEKGALEEAAKMFGSEEPSKGKQELRSEHMKPKRISDKERDRIEESFK